VEAGFVLSMVVSAHREHLLSRVIHSIESQTLLPGKMLVYYSRESWHLDPGWKEPPRIHTSVPMELREVENMGSCRKYLFTLQEYRNRGNPILLIDDDIIWRNDVFATLAKAFANRGGVITTRGWSKFLCVRNNRGDEIIKTIGVSADEIGCPIEVDIANSGWCTLIDSSCVMDGLFDQGLHARYDVRFSDEVFLSAMCSAPKFVVPISGRFWTPLDPDLPQWKNAVSSNAKLKQLELIRPNASEQVRDQRCLPPLSRRQRSTTMSTLRTFPDDLYAITCFYNPSNYRTKLANYEIFRSKLVSELPLMTIECAFGDSGFVLGTEDCLRIRTEHVLWQKERLLNIAARHVPSRYSKIVWLDCDVIFENEVWPQLTSSLLEAAAVVQPFSQILRLPRGADFDVGNNEWRASFAMLYEAHPNLMVLNREHGHTGIAWAARRELFDRVGLYDACVSGSGDHIMAHAFCGDWDSSCLLRHFGTGSAHLKHFQRWCERVYPLVRAKVKAVPGSVLHMWHGETKDRNYLARNSELARIGFDPDRDLAEDAGDCWIWAGEKAHYLENWARHYFAARKEDGDVAEVGMETSPPQFGS
jgi:hypothetical protein